MGGEARVTDTNEATDTEPRKLEREVEEIRDGIDEIVGELDQRGRSLLDWRQQLFKHRLLLAGLTAGWVLAFGVTLSIRAARRRRRNRPLEKARRLRRAVERMVEHPELVAQPRPGIAKKALSAATGAIVSIAVKKIVSELAETLDGGDVSIRVMEN
jgi:hypothetical protein